MHKLFDSFKISILLFFPRRCDENLMMKKSIGVLNSPLKMVNWKFVFFFSRSIFFMVFPVTYVLYTRLLVYLSVLFAIYYISRIVTLFIMIDLFARCRAMLCVHFYFN